MSNDLLIPPGARLVHVGPYKTGSTALQSALHEARPVLAQNGVVRLGDRPHESAAVLYATGRLRGYHDAARAQRRWERLVRQSQRLGTKRGVISSESFSQARPEVVRRVVDDLGPDGIHVAVTLRPLTTILASQWQQNVLRGTMPRYGAWLRQVFDAYDAGTQDPHGFWMPHRHDLLVRRWADVVGPDAVTVVVLDPADRGMLTSTFESMLGLPGGTLVPRPDRLNRSLSGPEAELLRRYHRQSKAAGVSGPWHYRLLRAGAEAHLKARDVSEEPKVATPQWALDRAQEVGSQMADAIAASGARVVGDVTHLAPRTEAPDSAPVTVPPELAARWSAALALAGETIASRATGGSASSAGPDLGSVSGRALVGELRRRAARRLGRR
ncbi:hypothetical protein CLV56_1112 [Mumia flava]|uniref:Sulfotransferase family protein n=1 Tax=Mumia flava TaxID=1348852 RepID=A0A2M9BG19_9ACTN|nr:hypothetical protein [Mumia flava]PJJ56897.1 hypothetical protein CLV56_1112 [Mumia flava]